MVYCSFENIDLLLLSAFTIGNPLVASGPVPESEDDGADEHHSENEGVDDDACLKIVVHNYSCFLSFIQFHSFSVAKVRIILYTCKNGHGETLQS